MVLGVSQEGSGGGIRCLLRSRVTGTVEGMDKGGVRGGADREAADG